MLEKLREQDGITVYKGDCFEVLPKLLETGCKVDLVLTDPPYKFEPHRRGINANRTYLNGMGRIGTDKDLDIYNETKILDILHSFGSNNIFVFCNKAQVLDLLLFAKNKNYRFDILPFCKSAPTPLTNNQWLPDREFGIHMFNKQTVKGAYNTKRGWFFIAPNFKDSKVEHPTAKPVPMIEKILQNTTEEGDLVLDPFGGSGSVAIACKNIGRRCIIIERDEEYARLILDRLDRLDILDRFLI